jgi:hypothetical protein
MALSTAVFIGESKEWYDLPPSSPRPCRVCRVTRPLELGSRASSLSTLVVGDRKSRHTSTLAVADGVFLSHCCVRAALARISLASHFFPLAPSAPCHARSGSSRVRVVGPMEITAFTQVLLLLLL